MAYLKILLSSVTIYICIVIFIRVFGKKELAQLSVIDLVFLLLISNSVQNAMVGADTTLFGGLTSAATLFIVNYFFKLLMYKFPKFSRVVQGHALLLIYKGKLLNKNLKKAKITRSEINEVVREHGVLNIGEIDMAVLEIDGNISILSNNFKQSTIKKLKKINKNRE